LEADTATILVDCSSTTANHLLSDSMLRPVAVIDHHESVGRRERVAYRDVRPKVAASATIAASYLREQQVEPSPELATALLYAITTETKGSEFHYSKLDRRIVTWLSEKADLAKLAEIENAPLSHGYYSDLVLALQSTFVYDEAAICYLPRAEGAEIIGEVADLLVRSENLKKILCAAIVDGGLYLSVRTDRDAGNAAELVQRTLEGLGMGGGHEHRAGGKIPLTQHEGSTDQVFDQLRSRWLAACHVDRQRGTRLVPKREIVRNL
jgi:nanoRNase/pAp phosphatase (c-di-AMP/oligoRNAs hydrolase)